MIIVLATLIALIQIIFGHNILLDNISNSLNQAHIQPKQSKITFTNASFSPAPELKPGATPPSALASSAIVYDVASGRVIYGKDMHNPAAIASLTKLMTTLVILQNHSPDEIVTIPDNLPPLTVNDQKINVLPGEKFKLSELMQALLIYSANDVANSLAIWDAGSIDNFTAKMNNYSKQWGLSDSYFVNPSGLDDPNQRSSAADLLVVANILLHNNSFRTIVNKPSSTIYNTSGKSYVLTTTNKDLSLDYVYGIKTGFTDLAGQCLILLAQKNGHEIIAIVLNSPDRFQESKNMVEYTFNNYIWK